MTVNQKKNQLTFLGLFKVYVHFQSLFVFILYY